MIHLVHGTQFYLWRKPAIHWVEQESSSVTQDKPSFRGGLRKCLEARGHIVEFREIPWSGRNRHNARLAAGYEIRKNLVDQAEGWHHFLVAHSHGGNACMLALREPDRALETKLSGVVCLSTPFLVVREAAWAVAATVGWMTLTMVSATLAIQSQVDGVLLSIGIPALCLPILVIPVFMILKRYKDVKRWIQAPDVCRVPFLIVRCPDDEASSGLGFAGILARIVFHLEHLAAWPVRTLQRHPMTLWLVGTGLVIAFFIVSTAVSPRLMEWVSHSWKWGLVILLGPWLLGLPLRLLIYGLAYGIDMLGLPLLHSISAEATPLGHWDTWLVPTSDSEELRSAHSETYELPSVHGTLADWFDERVAAPTAPTLAASTDGSLRV